MINTKEWFIEQYNDIHSNLSIIEKEIEYHLENKENLIGREEILETLKNKAQLEVERLKKTRENERRIFNY
jgi:uncharacterized membrane protein